jgi:hypothetical protein
MELSPQNVTNIVLDCLFQEGEAQDDVVKAEGITARMGFHPARLNSHKDDIKEMLALLPIEFSEGGGWSFLNLCNDRNGSLWTGDHAIMETLCVLAIATGLGQWTMPKEMWSVLPGQMPYFTIN